MKLEMTITYSIGAQLYKDVIIRDKIADRESATKIRDELVQTLFYCISSSQHYFADEISEGGKNAVYIAPELLKHARVSFKLFD